MAGTTPGSFLRWPVPARTCGPLGYRDAGDPTVLSFLSDTPGPLGICDYGAPGVPGFKQLKVVNSVPANNEGSRKLETQASTEASRITSQQLRLIFPNAKSDGLQKVADDLNVDLVKYGLDNVLRKAHFFAQVRQEAGAGLKAQVESLNYSHTALENTFKYYRDHKKEAEADGYAKDPKTGKITRHADEEKIANNVYAKRNGNGDTASGDGWKYRGRGFIQLTGRANYKGTTAQYGKLYPGSIVDFEKNPDLVAQFPYDLRCAVCYWIQHDLHKLADLGSADVDVDRITAVVNKHSDSYADRRANFKIAYGALK